MFAHGRSSCCVTRRLSIRFIWSTIGRNVALEVVHPTHRQTGPYDLHLAPSPTLEGVVTEQETGNAIVGAVVGVVRQVTKVGEFKRIETETDASGHFEIHGLLSEEHYVFAWAEEFAEKMVQVRVTGESTRRDLKLEKGEEVLVLVIDELRQPIEGAQIVASHQFYLGGAASRVFFHAIDPDLRTDSIPVTAVNPT